MNQHANDPKPETLTDFGNRERDLQPKRVTIRCHALLRTETINPKP